MSWGKKSISQSLWEGELKFFFVKFCLVFLPTRQFEQNTASKRSYGGENPLGLNTEIENFNDINEVEEFFVRIKEKN